MFYHWTTPTFSTYFIFLNKINNPYRIWTCINCLEDNCSTIWAKGLFFLLNNPRCGNRTLVVGLKGPRSTTKLIGDFWRRWDLNPQHFICKTNVLPLNYIPIKPYGIWTRVFAVKEQRPNHLDERFNNPYRIWTCINYLGNNCSTIWAKGLFLNHHG